MAKDFAFLFMPGDYLRDTQCLSEKAQVAYDRIMCEHMRNISITQSQLNFFTKRLNDEEKEELMMVLLKTDAGFQIEWVVESITKRVAYSKSRSENRTKKQDKNEKDMLSHDNDMESENEKEYKDEKENKKDSIETQNFKNEFEQFREAYPGRKRGLDNEFEHLKKKHKNWKEIIPKLKTCLKQQFYAKEENKKNGHFEPEWQNLETYINKSSWEIEIEIKSQTQTPTKNGKQSLADQLAAANNIISGLYNQQ